MVITRGVDRGSGLHPVNEVFCWGLGLTLPSRVNFNMKDGALSSLRWQTHDARIDIIDIAAARCHNIALDRIGRVFSWGFGADNLGMKPTEVSTRCSTCGFHCERSGHVYVCVLASGVDIIHQ